jgi:hypothetical protein
MSRKSSDEKIECRTPTPGKAPTRIPKWKYDAIRKAILAAAPKGGEGVRFADLPDVVVASLNDDVLSRLGSILWHVTTVKLHMETIGELERTPGATPQRVRRPARPTRAR